MKKIIIILALIFSSLSFSTEQTDRIMCYIPKELKTNSKARLIYEDRNLRLYKRDMRILKQIGFKDIENIKNLKI